MCLTLASCQCRRNLSQQRLTQQAGWWPFHCYRQLSWLTVWWTCHQMLSFADWLMNLHGILNVTGWWICTEYLTWQTGWWICTEYLTWQTGWWICTRYSTLQAGCWTYHKTFDLEDWLINLSPDASRAWMVDKLLPDAPSDWLVDKLLPGAPRDRHVYEFDKRFDKLSSCVYCGIFDECSTDVHSGSMVNKHSPSIYCGRLVHKLSHFARRVCVFALSIISADRSLRFIITFTVIICFIITFTVIICFIIIFTVIVCCGRLVDRWLVHHIFILAGWLLNFHHMLIVADWLIIVAHMFIVTAWLITFHHNYVHRQSGWRTFTMRCLLWKVDW